MKARRAGQRGFTLLELLVAVALTGIVLIALMSMFRNMVMVSAYIRQSRESVAQIRALVGLLGDDLLTVSREFAFTGTTGENDGQAVRLLEFAGGVSVERQEAEPDLTQVLVAYDLVRLGDEEEWTLMRDERKHPTVARGRREVPRVGEWEESPIPVLRNVETLKFYYEWPLTRTERDFCSVPPGGSLPGFVRLEVVLRYGGRTAGYSLRFPVGLWM